MNENLIALLIFFIVVAANFGGMLAASTFLGPRRRNPVKDEPFECGSIPVGPTNGRFHVRFYMVAMLFLIFDIEVVFLYPFVLIFKESLAQGTLALGAVGLFLVVLTLGLIYEWRRGGMEWD